jgi:phosphoserine phosphatase
VAGEPNFRDGKVRHVEAWLSKLGLSWNSLEDSYFYSDSMNDLPLLEKVKNPIATNPDDRLRQLATAKIGKY